MVRRTFMALFGAEDVIIFNSPIITQLRALMKTPFSENYDLFLE